jgi:mannose-1-phosphate guanylyltransferase
MARVMVLGAGLGTRLAPLTDELPKPLVPIGDEPMLARVSATILRGGFSEFVLNVHAFPGEFVSVINGLSAIVHVVHEPEIRGTAGGVAGARSLLGPAPVIVLNGDILVEPPFVALENAARPGGLVFGVARRPPGTGTVGVDARGHIVRLRGETFGVETAGGDYVGVAALGADVLAALPERGCLVADVALPRLGRGEPVKTVQVTEPWVDIGSLGAYHAANLTWLERHSGPSGSFLGEGARVDAGVEVASSIVGAGAHVVGQGRVHRTVIWPGATAHAPLEGAIVTRRGRVAVVP